jgi:TatD DNase family protein
MLFDSHTHLNFDDYTDEERKKLAGEIEESQVGCIIDAGDSISTSVQALRDAADYPWCYAAVGIHPSYARISGDDDIARIRELADDKKAVAIGEIGLDFYYGKDDREEQITLFRKQIRLALELEMPIMVHTRDADQLTMDILREEGAFDPERLALFPERPAPDGGTCPDARVQIHCFSGSAELGLEYARLGATLSLGGPVTFKNARKPVEVVKRVPLEFIMSETDAPYLTPVPFRGRPNKSPYIEHVVRRMAMIRDIPYEEAERMTWENGCRFFGIDGDALGRR